MRLPLQKRFSDLTFAGKVGVISIEAFPHAGLHSTGRLLALPSNIILATSLTKNLIKIVNK